MKIALNPTLGAVSHSPLFSTPTRRSEAPLRQAECLRLVHDVSRAVLAAVPLDDLAQQVLERLVQLLSCRHASLGLFDFQAHETTVLAAFGPGQDSPRPRLDLDLLGGMDLLRQGKVDLVRDLSACPEAARWAQAFGAAGLGSLLRAPLIARDDLIGCLSLGADRRDAFPPESVELARALADQLAVAVQHACLQEQHRAGRRRLRALSRRLLEVQEAERRRLAHDLHDEIGQALTAVKINLDTVQRSPAGVPAGVQECAGLVERALQQVRNLALDLRPFLLDTFGLAPALRWYVDRLAQHTGLEVRLLSPPPAAPLPPEVETACFRVAQEALTNVARHAQARRADVEVRHRGAELELVVRDDGVGFDVPAACKRAARGASLGLLGMRERTRLVRGTLTITARPGHGTLIRACFPLTSPSPAPRHRKRSPGR